MRIITYEDKKYTNTMIAKLNYMTQNTFSSQLLVDAIIVKPQACQTSVDAILLRTKRGPYNKPSKNIRRENVYRLYFEEGNSVKETAENLGIHRNTVAEDVKFWNGEFEKHSGGDEITNYFYRQKSLFDSQKSRILKKLKNESDFETQYKLEKLLFGLYDREMKFYLKFKPVAKNIPKPATKLVKKVIRELAFDNFSYFIETGLIKAIISKTKCDASTANLIVYEMRNLGLDYTKGFADELTSMTDFAKMCGCISAEEDVMIKKERILRDEQQDKEYDKRLAEYKKEFEEEFGDSKNWSDEVKKKYKEGFYRLG